MTLHQDFADAKALIAADEILFQPLIEKFEELKKVLTSNFLMKHKEHKWYGKTVWVVTSPINIEIADKIDHITGKYLFIRINGYSYVMGIGQRGELYDRLYFCKGSYPADTKDKTVVYKSYHVFGNTDYYLENNITCVQLFADMIKKYKNYLREGKKND